MEVLVSSQSEEQHRPNLPSIAALLNRIDGLRTEMFCQGMCASPRPLYEFYILSGEGEKLVKEDTCITCSTRNEIEIDVEEGKDPHWLRTIYSDRLETWRSRLFSTKDLAIDDGEMQWLKKKVKKMIEDTNRSGVTRDLALRIVIAEQGIVAMKEQIAQQDEAIAELQQKLQGMGSSENKRGIRRALSQRTTRSMSRVERAV